MRGGSIKIECWDFSPDFLYSLTAYFIKLDRFDADTTLFKEIRTILLGIIDSLSFSLQIFEAH